ncbi:MAG: iron-containing alcohol dehydrogenase [Rhodobacteraceae bacterium]|nr:iron-containing alcohol dehydrogenase [Paracoccaceae bacterium]
MNSFDMGRVPAVSFGNGRVADTAQVVGDLGGGPVFLIADAALAELGIAPELANTLNDAGLACTLSAEIVGEPKEALIDRLTEQTRSSGARVVVGLGGGAAMDAAKLVAAIAPSETEARLYALASAPIPKTGLPAIAIPTTAGTGSEVTRTSIVSTNSGAKNWYWSEELMFAHAILDPGLTVSLPPHLTAWTGIDAVAHALEAVTSRRSNAAGQMYGLEALRLLSDALPIAVTQGDDIDARSQVLWASTLAGLALHNCNTHMGHNISHALGSLARIHHGLATGLALEVTLPWLVDQPDGGDTYALAAQALGAAPAVDELPDAFASLMRACEIARALPEVCAGVTSEALASEMKSPANRSMSLNAACTIQDDDLDDMAHMMMSLPIAQAA